MRNLLTSPMYLDLRAAYAIYRNPATPQPDKNDAWDAVVQILKDYGFEDERGNKPGVILDQVQVILENLFPELAPPGGPSRAW